MSYSPGPWKMHKHLSPKLKYRYSFQALNGDTVCRIVASDMDDSEVEAANASIIESSPRTLNALQHLLEAVEKGYTGGPMENAKRISKAAIAKALGQV